MPNSHGDFNWYVPIASSTQFLGRIPLGRQEG